MTHEEIYHAATRLWFDSGVERLGEGHPGIPGPSSDDTEWDRNRAYLEGEIATLQLIYDRKYLA